MTGVVQDGLWTKAECDRCPELAARLHSRILDLQDNRTEYAKRLTMAVELLERIERESHWVGVPELEQAIEDFTDMMREDGWVS